MKLKIRTPEGPRLIPDWAKCYCVTDHRPNYIHPYPFSLPSGDEIWLCPNTYHQANTLLGMYRSLNGPPKALITNQFNYFVRSLITLYWQQVMEARKDDEEFELWKTEKYQDVTDLSDSEIFDFIKKVVADG